MVSQRLAPKRGGGRLLLTEVMGTNLRVREAIAFGENENRTFYDIIEASSTFGWQTFDQSIVRAYEADLLTEETANLYATRKGARDARRSTPRKNAAASSPSSTPGSAARPAATPRSPPQRPPLALDRP